MKLSEEVEKCTLPCQKNVYRINGRIELICNKNEIIGDKVIGVDWRNPNERFLIEVKQIESLLDVVWNGK